MPLFHPQIIKISTKRLALVKHRMFTFAASQENDLVCINADPVERPCGFPTFTFPRLPDTHPAPQ